MAFIKTMAFTGLDLLSIVMLGFTFYVMAKRKS